MELKKNINKKNKLFKKKILKMTSIEKKINNKNNKFEKKKL